jgi:predicted ATPase/serine phosphatase RsbU (regulator of sigma subunit)/tRNA A-37 threonylcarbamoyl transferase component Bud32
MVNIADYEVLSTLYEGSRSIVYRGQRSHDQQPIVLKLMQMEYPSLEELGRYRLEYEIINRLEGDGVAKAYDLTPYQNGLMLVLEDFGGESLQKLLQSRRFHLKDFLELAIALTDSLGKIHAAHIIHKDINPANIVLNPVSGQVKFIDFGNATVLSRENPSIRSPNVLEGTLLYLSPEQTGRMNRALDYRTDFYSLGATFYELLTGQPPFTVHDAMELIHCHLAKQPEPPHLIQPEIPIVVSQIVLKLLAKNAEDRYQSAYGIKADLQQCLEQLCYQGSITPFALAQQDASGKFQIPQKLYGRETEVELLLAGFERVAGGGQTQSTAISSPARSELMLVSGYSGIGKSALVNEVHKPITRKQGYFISGKYDQFQRNIPYSALIRAFQELIRQLLTESPAQIDRWRLQLLSALGSNGQVVTDVIPEVGLIIGEQLAVPELAPKETQNRFNLVFQKFIQVFTQAEHPLVIFLDDLQWADSASLKLLKLLLTAPKSQFLFLVGAYRSNEVNRVHPLMVTIADLENAGVTINQIDLTPLELPTVTQLVSETFNGDSEQAEPLAELVLQATGGNPFFINEFLKSLYEEGLLNFNAQQGCWQWDLTQVRDAQIPDNVVQLMTEKIQKLNLRTQQALKLAACIGNQFDSKTLAVISEKSQATIAADLWQGVQEGLILPLEDNYKLVSIESQPANTLETTFKFLHDRVQQAAYLLIPEAEKQAIHQTIGQLLLTHTRLEEREDKIFDIVNQLNLGSSQIKTQSERDELAVLNLTAGKKAKDSAAFETAVRYLLTGIDLLGTEGWQRQYALTLSLHEEAAESAYSNADFAETERLVDRILHHAKTVLDCVRAYQVRASAYTAQNNMQAAISTIIGAIDRLGETLPQKPNRLRVGLELLYTRFWVVGRRSTQDLEALSPMTNPYKLAITQLIGAAALASTNVDPLFMAILALRVVNLVIRYGSSTVYAVQGVAYGIMLRVGLGDIDGAYRFCQLSLRSVAGVNDRLYRTLAVVAFESCIRHWKEPLRLTLPELLHGYHEGLDLGNQEYASLSVSVYCIHQFFVGEPLAEVKTAFQEYENLIQQFKQEVIVYQMRPWHQLILNLQNERTNESDDLNGAIFNEAEMLPIFEKNCLGIPTFYTYIAKAIWLYHCGKYAASLEAARLAEPLQETAPVTTAYANWYFYRSLACLALCSTTSKPNQPIYLKQVAKNQRKAKQWALCCPANYQHRYHLVEAERLRVLGKTAEAMQYYDRAIQGAIEQEYINEAALANELAGKFYLRLGRERVAQTYLLDARHCYLRWGATFKVAQLDAEYPQLRDRKPERTSSETRRSISKPSQGRETLRQSTSRDLDLDTVIEAAQAISGEIILDKLLEKLLQLVIQNAGAQKGYLLLAQGSELKIEAEGQIDRQLPILVQSRPITTDQELPISIIHYVQRTQENVVLGNAAVEGRFTTDPHVLRTQPQSVLCTPILNQGNLTGILYLENNLATDTFTPERLTVLSILSAQAAIALENASFYRTLEQKVEERTAQLAQANQEITQLNDRLQSENVRLSAELDITRRLQQMILPKDEELSQIPGLDIAGFMEPADEVGGDYYDVLHDNGIVKIGIGDVTGHGLESGVLMLMVQTAVRTLLTNQETDSARFLSTLNRVIYENVQRMNSERNLTLALLDYQTGRLRLSGQHEDVLIVRTDGAIERINTIALGFPVGLVEDIAQFVAHREVQLQPGDGVVLYTDGITEAINPAEELYGIERLCQNISQHWHKPARDIQQAVIEDLRSHISDQKIFDDITLLILKQK